jgi:hypothetical protein
MIVKPITRTAWFAAWSVLMALGLVRLSAAPRTPAISQQAQNKTPGCRARIEIIRFDLDAIYAAGGISGDHPRETYLAVAAKLTAAQAALEDARPRDALDRLKEFEAMTIFLRDVVPPQLSPPDAQVLLFGDSDRPIDEGVNGAIICVWLMD